MKPSPLAVVVVAAALACGSCASDEPAQKVAAEKDAWELAEDEAARSPCAAACRSISRCELLRFSECIGHCRQFDEDTAVALSLMSCDELAAAVGIAETEPQGGEDDIALETIEEGVGCAFDGTHDCPFDEVCCDEGRPVVGDVPGICLATNVCQDASDE